MENTQKPTVITSGVFHSIEQAKQAAAAWKSPDFMPSIKGKRFASIFPREVRAGGVRMKVFAVVFKAQSDAA
jgi:hypothetical protein